MLKNMEDIDKMTALNQNMSPDQTIRDDMSRNN